MFEASPFMVHEAAPFPNSALPVLVYPQAIKGERPAFDALFARNGWTGVWVNGIYSFHHFHATAHEALGCHSGWARVKLGGPAGQEVTIRQGDAVLLPAGVGHCLVAASPDFRIAGAYPPGQTPDLRRGRQEEFESARAVSARVPLPGTDPVMGEGGPAMSIWRAALEGKE